MDCVAQLLLRCALPLCVGGLLCLYAVYYLVFCVARPRVVCSDARRLRALRRHCPVLFERQWPLFWAPQGHAQSIIRLLAQRPPRLKEPRREKVRMSDGGHVCLDWFNERGSMEERGSAGSEDDPIVLMLPGVTGSSDENYIQHWIDDVNRLGYRSVVFNYRGCGNSKLSTPRLYSLGDVSDLTEVVEHVHSTHTSSTIVAVGVSMGSIQAINYVAQCKRQGRPCHISAVLVFSTVWNLTISDMALHNHCFNRNVLSRFLAMRFTNIMRQNRTMFEECQNRGELSFNFQTALKSRHLRDLHNSCISHMFGYKADIVRSHSPCEHAHEVTVPVVAVNAADDPFSPLHALPVEVAEENGNLVLVTTRTGGHIGFVRWLHPFHKNYMDTILVQFLTAVLRHRCFERDYR